MNEENKIKREIPDGKRCCLCFPLRYGLKSWGYFKMIVSAFFILVISYALLHTCMMLGYNGSENAWTRIYADIGITCIALTFFVADFLITMLFVVGACQKNLKLLKAFHIFSIAIWAITIMLSAMAVGLSIESWLTRYMSKRSFIINLLNFSAYCGIIFVQTYFLILLRTRRHIVKPKNKGDFKFVNKPTEAECTMKCEVKIAEDETDTEDE